MTAQVALESGLVGTARLTVGREHTARALGSGRAEVLATPMLVALMEEAAVAAVEDHLPAGRCSLGTHIEVRHTAPTAPGAAVTAAARLVGVDGRTLAFEIEARDPAGVIGTARHIRAIVDTERFLTRLAERKSA